MDNLDNQNDIPQETETTEPLFKSIVVAAIVGFAVVSYWRGIWYLWDVLVFPGHQLYSGIASTLTGVVILVFMRTFYSVLAPPLERMNIR